MCDDPEKPDIWCTGDCAADGQHNCGEAKYCFLCPAKYLGFAWKHCDLVSKLKKGRPITPNMIRTAIDLEQNDRCCGTNYLCGCMCCPCAFTVCTLSLPVTAFTYFGAMVCRCFGLCQKDKNRVEPFDSE